MSIAGPATPALPLGGHVVFESDDLDVARDCVARIFCPHRLATNGAGFMARHHHVAGDRLSLNYIEYGASTRINPGTLDRFYLLQIPLCGGALVRNGAREYQSSPECAALLNPHLPTDMVWHGGTRQVLVQLDRQAMTQMLAATLGGPSGRTLTFDGPVDLTRGAGAALRRLVLWMVAEVDQGMPPIGTGLLARQLETSLLSGILEAAGHDHRGMMDRARAAPRPRQLKLAEEYILANLDQPLTLEDLAQVAGCTPRTLQLIFRDQRGQSPLAFWRDQRLLRAHQDLATGQGSVTEIALRWGFAHFGRFSEIYRARFGLSPSDTLKSRRFN